MVNAEAESACERRQRTDTFTEINKGDHAHFTSAHGRLGLVTFILIGLQTIVGFVQYWIPTLVLGSVDNGKALYKYHRYDSGLHHLSCARLTASRVSGYLIIILSLATICAATQTGFNENSLHIRLWAVTVASVLVLVGLVPRIKKHKLGF